MPNEAPIELKGAIPMIQVIAVITGKPGIRDSILQTFRANVPAVKAEKGNT